MAVGIVTGGGKGVRLGMEMPKLEVEILGRALLYYSLEAFQQADSVESVIITVPGGRGEQWRLEELGAAGFSKLVAAADGGESRQESVLNALRRVSGDEDVVVVHDVARPLVTPELIDSVCRVPEGVSGVICAVPVTDTIKEVDSGVVVSTPTRDRLVAVQTPQGFRMRELMEAHLRAVEDRYGGTDDASLVERMGGKVVVVEGDRDNIKVTYPQDIARAEVLLRARGYS